MPLTDMQRHLLAFKLAAPAQVNRQPFERRQVTLVLELHRLNMPQEDRQIASQYTGHFFRLRFKCGQENFARQQ
ncbi:hypothetical protein D3C75_931500 [compost metagenome]